MSGPRVEFGVELGVDLGTSNTVAVLRGPDGRNRTLLFDGSPLLPSAVYAEPAGAIVVGRDAVHSARLDPARFEPNPKRRVDDGVVLLGDRELPVTELLGAVLRRVVEEFHRTMGGPVTPRVTITCPAAWGATRRLLLSDAAAAAGLGPVRLVPEPVAAATYFTQVLGRAVPVGSAVVVHDFGAGTFDASVVARTASGFEVLAVDGRDDIGGLDVDEAIIEFIRKIAVERDAATWERLARPSTVDDRRARRLLWDDVRIAKERLSRQPAADLNVPLLGIDVHLTRPELEGLAQGVVEQTVRVTQGVIRWAKLPEGRLAGVFLVGGSSRMPLVATLLHRALGEPPVVIDSPELVVAEGSLLAGARPGEAGGRPGEDARPVANPATGIHAPIFNPDGSLVYPEFATPAGAVTSGAGGITSGGVVSGPPAGAGPLPVNETVVAGRPVSGPPGRPTSGGAVYTSRQPPVDPEATQRVAPNAVQPVSVPPVDRPAPPPRPVYLQGVSRPSYPPPVPSPPEPVYRPSRYDDVGYDRHQPAARVARSGAAGRVFRTVLVTMLLVLVPIVCGYVAYRYSSGQGLLP